MNRNDRRELASFVKKALKRKISDIQYPGGESRDSIRLVLDNGRTVISTRRPSDRRATRELEVLLALQKNGALVPKVYGFNGTFLLQQDLGETRLSQALHAEDAKEATPGLLDAALTSMASYQDAARASGLAEGIQPIGHEIEWRRALANVPSEVGEMTGIAPPEFDQEAVANLLEVKTPSFVKWDSRPGNALVAASGNCYWFDWEHSGVRNSADDLVWLMADEFVTFDKSMEADLFARHLPNFTDGKSLEETEHYVRTLGCFHSMVRFELILDNKGDGKWWSLQKCLDGDKVGVVRRCCRRILWRGAAWADHDELTRPLVPWFQELEAYIEAL